MTGSNWLQLRDQYASSGERRELYNPQAQKDVYLTSTVAGNHVIGDKAGKNYQLASFCMRLAIFTLILFGCRTIILKLVTNLSQHASEQRI